MGVIPEIPRCINSRAIASRRSRKNQTVLFVMVSTWAIVTLLRFTTKKSTKVRDYYMMNNSSPFWSTCIIRSLSVEADSPKSPLRSRSRSRDNTPDFDLTAIEQETDEDDILWKWHSERFSIGLIGFIFFLFDWYIIVCDILYNNWQASLFIQFWCVII